MSMIRICVPVTGSTRQDFFNALDQVQTQAEFIELRVDYCSEFTPQDIPSLKQRVHKPAIFTCRTQAEGGLYSGTEAERIQMLEAGITAGFPYVDIEWSTLQNNQVSRSPNTQLIISYHNFERTPSFSDLERIMHEIASFDPDIIKIATMTHEDQDVQTLFRLLAHRTQEMIVLGMGEPGKIVRILSPYLGGYLTFASSVAGTTAPGQIDIETLTQLYQSINSHL